MINFRRNIQICTVNIIAAIIGILMVGKMLYQIQYINHSNWDINCTVNMMRMIDTFFQEEKYLSFIVYR